MIKLTTGILLILASLTPEAQARSLRYHPKHLFVKMKDGQALAQSPLIKSSKRVIGQIFLVKTNSPELLEQDLAENAKIAYVQKDFYGTVQNTSKHEFLDPIKQNLQAEYRQDFDLFNDPDLNKLWGFGEKIGMNVIGGYAALPPYTPEEVIVAVVDTGVDHEHEDLKDVMWVNAGEIPGDGVDNDQNGYIDDIHGINTLVRDANGNATTNTLPSNNPNGAYHGTHVAGTIAASQDNGKGIAGVASNVKIMAIRTVPDNADELDSDIVEGFKYAASHGAKIINCSYGKDVNEGGMIVHDVMNEIAKTYGVLVIAAAGNSTQNIDSNPTFPASFETKSMLVVAASNSLGGLAIFSNTGKKSVDVAAPGTDIYSTLPGNKYGSLSGTSMATPNTAGVAAMVRGYFPGLTPLQVKKVLMDSVTKVPRYQSRMTSSGRVNLQAALQKAAEI